MISLSRPLISLSRTPFFRQVFGEEILRFLMPRSFLRTRAAAGRRSRLGDSPEMSYWVCAVCADHKHSHSPVGFVANGVRAPSARRHLHWTNRTMTASVLILVAISVHLRLRMFERLDRATAEREQAQESLRQSHDRLELIVEQRTSALHQLSSRLLQAQDEERRKIARELHDSVGQYLASLKISLDLLAGSNTSPTPRMGTSAELLQVLGFGTTLYCRNPYAFPLASPATVRRGRSCFCGSLVR